MFSVQIIQTSSQGTRLSKPATQSCRFVGKDLLNRLGWIKCEVFRVSDRKISMHVSPKKLGACLFVVALTLTFVSGVAQVTNILLGADANPLLTLLFVGRDASLPSWFSAVMLLACSVLSVLITHARRVCDQERSFHWWGLAIIFLYLSIDEAISIHEKLSPLGSAMLSVAGTGDFVQRAWVVPAVIVLSVLVLLYAGFFLRLPQRIRNLVLVAIGLFFGGAVGLEVLTDLYVYLSGGVRDLTVVENVIRTLIFPHIEEFAEMSGLIVFIYALLLHAREISGVYEFRFEK